MQPAHALAEFAVRYPAEFNDWQINHKNLVVLAEKDEESLAKLALKLCEAKVKYVAFYEPDIDNALTAIAIEPNIEAYKLTSSLPLALKM